MHGLIGVVICVRQVTCFEQGLPSEATRRRTAQHILDIMSSRSQGSRGQGQVKRDICQWSMHSAPLEANLEHDTTTSAFSQIP